MCDLHRKSLTLIPLSCPLFLPYSNSTNSQTKDMNNQWIFKCIVSCLTKYVDSTWRCAVADCKESYRITIQSLMNRVRSLALEGPIGQNIEMLCNSKFEIVIFSWHASDMHVTRYILNKIIKSCQNWKISISFFRTLQSQIYTMGENHWIPKTTIFVWLSLWMVYKGA